MHQLAQNLVMLNIHRHLFSEHKESGVMPLKFWTLTLAP